MSRARNLAAVALAAAIAFGVSGCTSEHEVTEAELERYMRSDRPFEVDGKPFSGRLVYRENDKVRVTLELEDGYPHGVIEAFHDNGERANRAEQAWDSERNRVVLDGESVEWNKDGVMVQRRRAKKGVDQRLERWCGDGDRRETIEYKDGKQHKREAWDCGTGKQVAEEHFDGQGRRHGEHKAWSSDGTLVASSRYAAGEPDGLQQEWHPDGKPKLKASFDNGVPTGRLERWNEAGELIEAGAHGADGAKTGLWLQAHGGTPSQVHYGPDGFISPEVTAVYVRALTSRPDAKAVSFLLDEGQVKVGDALPASYSGNASASSFRFPVSQWTYSIVVAAPSMLQLLVDRGADINQADSEGTTRLLRCAGRFSAERNRYDDPCRPDELETIIALGGKADATDRKGRGALNRLVDISKSAERNWGRPDVAAREARVAALQLLAKAGADPNAADADGYTPLVRALKARRPDLVRALIAAGARADTAGPEGSRAVHWLFLEDSRRYDINEAFVNETLPMLVAAGADPKAPMEWDGSQVTLRELAARHALVDMVNVLDNAAR